MDIHLITAFKGGSGKTLIALSILIDVGSRIAASKADQQQVWAVDLNSTNPNFYEILDTEGKLEKLRTQEDGTWLITSAKSRNPVFKVTIARPKEEFQLPGSVAEVWASLGELSDIMRRSSEVRCVIIDTDMNMLNLFEGDLPSSEQLSRVIGRTDCLYLWNIWMPHYFVDDSMHARIIGAEKLLAERKVNFSFVNVINEYLFSRDLREDEQIKKSPWQLFFQALFGARSTMYPLDLDQAAAEMLKLPSAPSISSSELLRDLQEKEMPPELYVADVLSDIYREKGGLPRNIVPVSRQIGLKDYIRRLQRNMNLKMIADELSGVRNDVATALRKLESESVRVP
jgi:hypothetical protein